MDADIFNAESDADLIDCFPVFQALRPHLAEADFAPRVRRQAAQGYRILALRREGVVRSVAGYRLAEFLAWGKILYIDDLATLPGHTGCGYAGALLDHLIAFARAAGCHAVHLDSGYARQAAHRLYLNKGFRLASHHFSRDFQPDA